MAIVASDITIGVSIKIARGVRRMTPIAESGWATREKG